MRLTAVPRAESDRGGDGRQSGGDRGGGEGGRGGGLGAGHHRAGWHIAGLKVTIRTGGFICKSSAQVYHKRPQVLQDSQATRKETMPRGHVSVTEPHLQPLLACGIMWGGNKWFGLSQLILSDDAKLKRRAGSEEQLRPRLQDSLYCCRAGVDAIKGRRFGKKIAAYVQSTEAKTAPGTNICLMKHVQLAYGGKTAALFF